MNIALKKKDIVKQQGKEKALSDNKKLDTDELGMLKDRITKIFDEEYQDIFQKPELIGDLDLGD